MGANDGYFKLIPQEHCNLGLGPVIAAFDERPHVDAPLSCTRSSSSPVVVSYCWKE